MMQFDGHLNVSSLSGTACSDAQSSVDIQDVRLSFILLTQPPKPRWNKQSLPQTTRNVHLCGYLAHRQLLIGTEE